MSIKQRLKRLETVAKAQRASLETECEHTIQILTVYPADTPLPLPPDPHGSIVCREGEEPEPPECAACDRRIAAAAKRGAIAVTQICFLVPRECVASLRREGQGET